MTRSDRIQSDSHTFPLDGRDDDRFPAAPFSLGTARPPAPTAVAPPTLEMLNPSFRKSVLVTSRTKQFRSASSVSMVPWDTTPKVSPKISCSSFHID